MNLRRVLCILSIVLGAVACSDDESLLENKWQLRQVTYNQETQDQEGRVFYNFQKGSFSAICLHENEEYYTFFGNYSLHEKELSIVLLEGSNVGEVYEKYINWEDGSRTFIVDKLTGSSLDLTYESRTFIFRKY